MNDSLRTDVFVRFKPEVIACACIFLAARVVKVGVEDLVNSFCLHFHCEMTFDCYFVARYFKCHVRYCQ